MKADEFIKTVMHVAGLPSREAAENAVRSTLETLSEHLAGGEPGNLAAQLPHDIAIYLNQPYIPHQQSFGLQQFFEQVAQREGVSYQQAERDAKAVMRVLSESVTQGLVDNVKAQLPCDIADLLNVQNMETEGQPGTQTSVNQQA
jgi:uncharacterized protein (DUF2267 family)